ncbi:MAG: helix-hairpin-helix domain-containing protein [Lachnospiraceae bacterium]|nr:helix-hairpin-helix domain-containing protein [Lachnospiraceae bacterium]
MRKIKRGLGTALLCVAMTVMSGCGKEEPLYTAGLSAETETVCADSGDSSAAAGTASDLDSSAGGTASALDSSVGDATGTDYEGITGKGTDSMAGELDSPAGDGVESDSLAGDAAGGTDADAMAGTDATGTDGRSAETSASGTVAGLDTGMGSEQTEAVIGYVYVCGAVEAPGVYPITADMRVCDAIELAGGFSPEADEEWLNQASAVSDGQKLYVYTREETSLMKESGMTAEGMGIDSSWSGSSGKVDSTTNNSSAGSGSSEDVVAADGSAGQNGGTSVSDGKVNINTATREELMTLPGIGESKADAILAYRSEHGAFASIEEIQNISGIKSGVFSQIKDLITV